MTTPTVPADDVDRLLAAVDGERMAATVAALAGAAFAGRRVGTPGGAAARAWLGQRLDDLDATVSFGTFSVRAVPEVSRRRRCPGTTAPVVATGWLAATKPATVSSSIGDRR